MEISSHNNIVDIDGNIKSISDFQNIKSVMDALITKHRTLVVNVNNSISITSSVIGYFNKLVLKDQINLELNISSKQLMELFDDLNLTTTFKIKVITSK